MCHKCQAIFHPAALQSMQGMLEDLIFFDDCLILITNDNGRTHSVIPQIQVSIPPTEELSITQYML